MSNTEMWYSVHNRQTLGSYGVFNEPQLNLPETQIQLEWSEDPAIVGEWVKPFKDPETGEIYLKEYIDLKTTILLNRLRTRRNVLLSSSDWTQLPDTAVDRNAWAQYRQALRDLPANTADLENPMWPCVPN
jgi:hypothetical protein